MIRFAENLNKMITAGLGGALEAPSTEVAVGHRVRYMEASGAVASFETNIAAPIRSLRVDMQPIQAGSGDPSPDNIRPITGRESVTVWREVTYDQSANPALTVQLGQTVYGGTLDVVSGKLTVDKAMVDLGTLTWTKLNNYVYGTFTSNIISNCVYSSTTIYWMCDTYKAKCNLTADAIGDNYIWIRLTGGQRVVIKDTSKADMTAEEFTAAMSGKMFIYTLETPQTITLTRAQLSTLHGTNNVWSNSGDVTLEYPYYEETEGY